MTVKCAKCGAEVADHERHCSVCGHDAGAPNVRSANRIDEVNALEQRYVAAKSAATAGNFDAIVDAFEASVLTSKAVMNRSLGALSEWVNGQSPLYLSFHNQVKYTGRKPSSSDWDQQREAAESAINPFCYTEIVFAALSIDETGMEYYGEYVVTLSSITIDDRTSVFEQNPFYFNRRHNVIAGVSPPLGYRAIWSERAKLAVAKLSGKLNNMSTVADFAAILMELRRTEADCDFVEAHIYGPIDRRSIERISGPSPSDADDQILWKQIMRKAPGFGATVQVTP